MKIDCNRIPILSVRQPWAWLIVNGYKDVENRIWRTNYRGMIYIHAPKTYDNAGHEWIASCMRGLPLPPKDKLKQGGIIGYTKIIDCVTYYDSDWFSGPYGFILDTVMSGQTSLFIKCKGQQRFFYL